MALPELNKRINSYRSALKDDPDNQEINLAAAFCYLQLGIYDKALLSFEKVMGNFDNSEAFFMRRSVCLTAGSHS